MSLRLAMSSGVLAKFSILASILVIIAMHVSRRWFRGRVNIEYLIFSASNNS